MDMWTQLDRLFFTRVKIVMIDFDDEGEKEKNVLVTSIRKNDDDDDDEKYLNQLNELCDLLFDECCCLISNNTAETMDLNLFNETIDLIFKAGHVYMQAKYGHYIPVGNLTRFLTPIYADLRQILSVKVQHFTNELRSKQMALDFLHNLPVNLDRVNNNNSKVFFY